MTDEQVITRQLTVLMGETDKDGLDHAAIAGADLIEDYPEDKYGPSCLLFGRTKAGRALHIQCSYPIRPLIKIITLYEPNAARWIDFKTRRS